MSFVFYPTLERSCPDVGHCPHLGGAAIGSVVLRANENDEWMQALYRQVDGLRADNEANRQTILDLKRQIEELKLELKAERQKQFKAKKESGSEEPEAGTKTTGKKRGAPVGHPGWFRPRPEHFDRLIPVAAPKECPHCRGRVKARPDLEPYDHFQEDWVDGKLLVTC